VIRKDKTALRAGSYCHSTLINTPNKENEHINIEVSFLSGFSTEFQKQYFDFLVLSIITGIMIDKEIIHAEK